MPQPLDTPWTHFISRNPNAKLRLFCFHYSGGNANVFSPWAQFIPNDIELCSILFSHLDFHLSVKGFFTE